MIVFNPPYNSLRQLGQAASAPSPASPPASPVTVVPGPAAVVPVPVAPAPVVVAPSGINYDQGIVSLSPAGLIVGGIVVVGLSLTLASAFSKR